jgi:hypothetical protein
MSEHKRYGKRARMVYRALIVVCTLALIIAVAALYYYKGRPAVHSPQPDNDTLPAAGHMEDPEAVKDGIHLRTGLIAREGYREVINNCTTCHSASLVIQNRMDARGWEETIKWMQETQNLWELGDKQEVIVNYLAENYPVEKKGRRERLKDIEWYGLNDSK